MREGKQTDAPTPNICIPFAHFLTTHVSQIDDKIIDVPHPAHTTNQSARFQNPFSLIVVIISIEKNVVSYVETDQNRKIEPINNKLHSITEHGYRISICFFCRQPYSSSNKSQKPQNVPTHQSLST
jgi:hypothetical protein